MKAISYERYIVGIKDSKGERHRLLTANTSDRLRFDKTGSKKVHNILLKGGQVQFWIKELETETTQYEFRIDQANWYDNAYRILTGN